MPRAWFLSHGYRVLSKASSYPYSNDVLLRLGSTSCVFTLPALQLVASDGMDLREVGRPHVTSFHVAELLCSFAARQRNFSAELWKERKLSLVRRTRRR